MAVNQKKQRVRSKRAWRVADEAERRAERSAHRRHGRSGNCNCTHYISEGDRGVLWGSHECAEAGCKVCKAATKAALLAYRKQIRSIVCRHNGCTKPILWLYCPSPGNTGYCDEHIPRGCSCNVNYHLDADGNEVGEPTILLDKHGREMPCVEYEYLGKASDL